MMSTAILKTIADITAKLDTMKAQAIAADTAAKATLDAVNVAVAAIAAKKGAPK
jgi:hypothetical protein